MNTRRSIFHAILAGLFAGRVKSSPSKVRYQAMLDFHKPILNIIGTGLMPPIKITHGEYRCVYVSGPSASERDVIARLIGRSGTHIVHLYGEWESIISRETFLNCWTANLCRNAVKPRLFVNGIEFFIINRAFFRFDPLIP